MWTLVGPAVGVPATRPARNRLLLRAADAPSMLLGWSQRPLELGVHAAQTFPGIRLGKRERGQDRLRWLARSVGPDGGFGRGRQLLRLRMDKRAVHDITVARDHRTRDELEEALVRRRPLQRVGVPERERSAFLDQVAGKYDAGVGDDDDQVVVRVASAQVVELDRSPSDLDRATVGDRPVGGNDLHL